VIGCGGGASSRAVELQAADIVASKSAKNLIIADDPRSGLPTFAIQSYPKRAQSALRTCDKFSGGKPSPWSHRVFLRYQLSGWSASSCAANRKLCRRGTRGARHIVFSRRLPISSRQTLPRSKMLKQTRRLQSIFPVRPKQTRTRLWVSPAERHSRDFDFAGDPQQSGPDTPGPRRSPPGHRQGLRSNAPA
jgi:hypothetical protein